MEILSEYVREKGMHGVYDITAQIEIDDNGKTLYIQVSTIDGTFYTVSTISIIDYDKMSSEEIDDLGDDFIVEQFWTEDETIEHLATSKYYKLYKRCEALVEKFEEDRRDLD